MTASITVTVPVAAATVGPRSTGTSEPRDGAGSGAPKDFDSQLHAARQQHDARGTDDASNNRDDRRHMPATPPSPDRQPDAARPADPGTVPAAVPVAAPAIETVVAATPAPADKNEPDDQPASAVAGAMLALLGSSVAAAPQPVAGAAGAAAGALVQAGKALAGDARAAAMPQLAGAVSPASLPAGMVSLAASAPMMADAALPAPSAVGKDAEEGHGLAMTLPAPPAAATAPAPPHQLQLPSPLGSQSFAHDLGQQVAWLGGQNIKQARIRLHPEELGSLDVSVSVTHGRVDVVFSAQHAAAIPAVQQSLPQLDQMLARHGLSLGHAEVGQRDRGDRRGHAGHAGAAAVDEIADVHGGMPMALGKVGLLDAFA